MNTTPTTWRRITAATAALALSVSLAACGDNESASDGATAASSASQAAFPVTIDTALGEVEIPAEPERVVTLGWGATEAALALGVTPVGIRDMSSDTGTDDGVLPWVKEKLGDDTPTLLESTSKDIPYEEIAELEPDAILAVQSGLTDEQYDKLSDIAPTVGYLKDSWQTPWQDQTTMVGKALGKEDRAKELVEEAEAKITKAKEEHPDFKGKTIASTGAPSGDGLAFYFAGDPRMNLLENLGFTPLPGLDELKEKAEPGRWATMVSWENLQDYQADVMTTWYIDEETKAKVEGNTLFQNMAPVKSGGYVPLTDPLLVFAASAPNVLNIDWILENYVPLLSEAAQASETES